MGGYIGILLRSVITFIGLLFLTHMMGRKQLSDGIIATVVWAAMPIIVGYIAVKNIAFRRFIDGDPKVVIQNGIIINKNMLRKSITWETC